MPDLTPPSLRFSLMWKLGSSAYSWRSALNKAPYPIQERDIVAFLPKGLWTGGPYLQISESEGQLATLELWPEVRNEFSHLTSGRLKALDFVRYSPTVLYFAILLLFVTSIFGLGWLGNAKLVAMGDRLKEFGLSQAMARQLWATFCGICLLSLYFSLAFYIPLYYWFHRRWVRLWERRVIIKNSCLIELSLLTLVAILAVPTATSRLMAEWQLGTLPWLLDQMSPVFRALLS